MLSRTRGGFSRSLRQELADQRIRVLVPIQFFDAAFKVEEAPKAASAIADIRSTRILAERVPQPYQAEGIAGDEATGKDLLDTLSSELRTATNTPAVRLVVGRAGIGKTFLSRALFAHLYDNFMKAKAQLRSTPRPVPLLPDHMKDLYALRTELLVENFLRTDVASPVSRETFEWLLVNGYATWLLDGLDELFTGDPGFFDYVLELVTRPGSKAQVVIWSRDSLLTTSDAFMEFQALCAGSGLTRIYRLLPWERPSKRYFAWLRIEHRHPASDECDTLEVNNFLEQVEGSPSLKALSGVPFYCDVLLRESRDGSVQEFADEVVMLDHLIDEMTSLIVDPPNGRIPPLTPEGQRRVDARAEARNRSAVSWEDRSLFERCVTRGLPRLPGGYNQNLQILQTPEQVVILYEMMREVRVIPLDGRPHLADNVRLLILPGKSGQVDYAAHCTCRACLLSKVLGLTYPRDECRRWGL